MRAVGTRVVAAGFALAAGAGAASFVACQLAFPTALLDLPAASPPVDAGSDAPLAHDTGVTEAEAAAPSFLCTGVQPPPPQSQDSNPTSVPVFYTAVHMVYYTVAADAGPPLGFNLDGVCTCEDGGPSSCNSGMFTHCDGPDGRDVAGNALLTLFDGFYASGSVSGNLDTEIAQGRITILIGIANYNGGADDTEVALTAFISSGIHGDGGFTPPVWDGNDAWDVDPISVTGWMAVDGGYAYSPSFVSTQAYVTGGVLVAYVPQVVLSLGFGTLELSTVVLATTLSPRQGSYRLGNGQLAGRVSTHSVLSLASQLPDPVDPSMSLCGSDPTYLTVRQSICQTADILTNASLDNTGATCDAISVSFGFEADPARLGAPISATHNLPGCDGAVDDCTPVDAGRGDAAQ